MRKVHLIVSASKGALPVLLAVTVVPMAMTCAAYLPGDPTSTSVGAGGSAGAGGTNQGGKGGTGEGGSILVSSVNSSSSSSGFAPCGDQTHTFVVQIPPEGTAADPGQICAIAMDPVTSNLAARVTLEKLPNADNVAIGHIALDPVLQAEVLGTPTIIVSADDPDLAAVQISNITPVTGGFAFNAEWPLPFNFTPYSWEKMTVKVSMYLRCDPQAMTMRLVESITYVNLCLDNEGYTWVSSGEVCNACDIIAEMAPSPIIPDKQYDDLPLGSAMRLRIVPLARIGASVVLFAENDGGEELTYSWHPSAGKIEQVASDIAIWTPPSDLLPHMIQVAVQGDDAAAVATYSWREAA